ncbi:MAG: glucose-6-phosphate dehydrogenase [Candidatus Levybacteria bacterium]|nr:glucose-6-phosphate dehydrogenase [Candidatus Levybacteria bacterium]
MQSSFVMVIFGATGDLAQNKLIPSLFSLFKQKQLPTDFFIVGFSRRELSDSDFGSYFKALQDKEGWNEFAKHLSYQKGSFDDISGYSELIDKLKKLDDKIGACVTRFFYLATPPDHYQNILKFLRETKLSEGCGPHFAPLSGASRSKQESKWTRIIIEKPFGKDLETAKALDMKLSEVFEEKQIFRVDHYLGKETMQNIIAFRFANGIFEPVWNKNFIDHVQITWAEEQGVKERGNFFDGVGLLRDVGQNHLMQLVTAVAMESPKSFSKEGVRDARAEVIKKIRCVESSEVSKNIVRGQYENYRSEKNVAKNSNTETFVAMKIFVDTDRMAGVPFYIRMGKKMPKNLVEISVVFIQTCHILFKEYGCPEIGNVLVFRIQPDEGINLRVIAKKPGAKLSLGTVNMNFSYEDQFRTNGADAYEKVLLDIFAGDQMLFNRSDELESSWEFITKILKGWANLGVEPLKYKAGTWGPEEAEALIEKDGRKWI